MRLASLLALTGVCIAAATTDVSAQSVSGKVTAVESAAPVEGARVVLRNDEGSMLRQTMTDATGAFYLAVPRPGRYQLDVSHDGFAAIEPVTIEVADEEALTTEIRLSRSVVALEPITVTGRRRDPRHDGTYEGALERYRQFPSLGLRRVMLPSDVELRSATRVGDALRHLPSARRCLIVYQNGNLVESEEWVEGWLESSAANLDALEFYREFSDAPQSYRNWPTWVRAPGSCSVLALWTLQEERPARGFGLLRAVVAGGMLLLLLITAG